MNLFQLGGNFTLASGRKSLFKVECDALREADWDMLAYLGRFLVPPFWRVKGVPDGGVMFAKALERYITPEAPLTLVCDDVWTTGGSMFDFADQFFPWRGLVAFARGPLPAKVTAIWHLAKELHGE